MFIKGWALTGFSLSWCSEVFCSACAFTYKAMTNVVYFQSRELSFYENSVYFKHLIPVVKLSTICFMWINTFVLIYNTVWQSTCYLYSISGYFIFSHCVRNWRQLNSVELVYLTDLKWRAFHVSLLIVCANVLKY